MSRAKYFIFSIIFLWTLSAHAQPWKSYLLNKEGVELLQKESFTKSIQSFLEALESDPLNPALHLNLGIAFMAQGEPQKAAKSFHSAYSMSANPEVRFVALFNRAFALAEAKEVAEALDTYQEALEFDPENLEVKTNIELLTSNQKQDGEGEGENDPNQDQGGGQGGDQEQKDQPEDQSDQEEKQKPQPREFKSQELSPSDVKKILEELKSQEQGIRAKEYEKGAKERPSGMDW